MLKKLSLIGLMVVVATALMAGCGPKKEEENGAEDEPVKAVFKATGDEGGLSGTVKFDGTPPAPKKIDMSQDANCLAAPGEKTTDDVVVSDGKLANVFVYVKGSTVDSKYRFEVPSTPVVLDQLGCRYTPRVLGIMTKQTLKVTNSDPTNHNVHPSPQVNPEWNQSQGPKGAPIEKSFGRPEILVPVKCNQHPWMKAHVGVLAHPYYAVSGKDGSYSIKGLPPGDYTLVAWHEVYGEKTQKITVGAKESKTVDFSYSASAAYLTPQHLRIEPALVLP
jgi:hypothetical protein